MWGPAVRVSLVKAGLPGTSTSGAGLWAASVLSAPRGLKSRSCPLVWESPSVLLWRREAPHVHRRSAPSPAEAGRLAAAPGRRDRTAGPGGDRRGSYHKPGITPVFGVLGAAGPPALGPRVCSYAVRCGSAPLALAPGGVWVLPLWHRGCRSVRFPSGTPDLKTK